MEGERKNSHPFAFLDTAPLISTTLKLRCPRIKRKGRDMGVRPGQLLREPSTVMRSGAALPSHGYKSPQSEVGYESTPSVPLLRELH